MPPLILTRSESDNARTAPAFAAEGFDVVSVPMLTFEPLELEDEVLVGLRGDEPVVLTSARATDAWLDVRRAGQHRPCCYFLVGERSRVVLEGSDPLVPIAYVARSAADLLNADFEGVDRVVYPCSAERRDELVDGLRERGIDVVELPLYRPGIPSDSADRLHAALATGGDGAVAIAFFSPSAVRNFFALVGEPPPGAIFGAVGRTTAGELAAHGARGVIAAEIPTPEALADAMRRHLEQR